MRSTQTPSSQTQSRQARLAALVIAGTMGVWMLAQLIGAHLGLDPRYAFLVDFAALAALFWALVVIIQIWRGRRV